MKFKQKFAALNLAALLSTTSIYADSLSESGPASGPAGGGTNLSLQSPSTSNSLDPNGTVAGLVAQLNAVKTSILLEKSGVEAAKVTNAAGLSSSATAATLTELNASVTVANGDVVTHSESLATAQSNLSGDLTTLSDQKDTVASKKADLSGDDGSGGVIKAAHDEISGKVDAVATALAGYQSGLQGAIAGVVSQTETDGDALVTKVNGLSLSTVQALGAFDAISSQIVSSLGSSVSGSVKDALDSFAAEISVSDMPSIYPLVATVDAKFDNVTTVLGAEPDLSGLKDVLSGYVSSLGGEAGLLSSNIGNNSAIGYSFLQSLVSPTDKDGYQSLMDNLNTQIVEVEKSINDLSQSYEDLSVINNSLSVKFVSMLSMVVPTNLQSDWIAFKDLLSKVTTVAGAKSLGNNVAMNSSISNTMRFLNDLSTNIEQRIDTSEGSGLEDYKTISIFKDGALYTLTESDWDTTYLLGIANFTSYANETAVLLDDENKILEYYKTLAAKVKDVLQAYEKKEILDAVSSNKSDASQIISAKVTELNTAISGKVAALNAAKDAVTAAVFNGTQAVSDAVTAQKTIASDALGTVGGDLISGIASDIATFKDGVKLAINGLTSNVDNSSDLNKAINAVTDSVTNQLGVVSASIADLNSSVKAVEGTISAIETHANAVSTSATAIKDLSASIVSDSVEHASLLNSTKTADAKDAVYTNIIAKYQDLLDSVQAVVVASEQLISTDYYQIMINQALTDSLGNVKDSLSNLINNTSDSIKSADVLSDVTESTKILASLQAVQDLIDGLKTQIASDSLAKKTDLEDLISGLSAKVDTHGADAATIADLNAQIASLKAKEAAQKQSLESLLTNYQSSVDAFKASMLNVLQDSVVGTVIGDNGPAAPSSNLLNTLGLVAPSDPDGMDIAVGSVLAAAAQSIAAFNKIQ